MGAGVKSIVVVCALAMGATVHASEAELIEVLQDQIRVLTERIVALENKGSVATSTYLEPQPTSAPAATATSSWSNRIKLKGDFRYRHEAFNIDDQRDRHRHRLRARTASVAQATDTVEVGFGLASGGSSPNSTNQSLGNGFSSKDLVLDLAYATWTTPVRGLDVSAGKFKNPVHRAGGTALIFDGDVTPEGIGLQYQRNNLFAAGLLTWIDESSGDDDSFLFAAQFGREQKLGDGELIAGLSYFNFVDARGEAPFFHGIPVGNRVNPDGTYLSGFELVEGFAEYALTINDYEVSLFADYVHNLEADDFATGYTVGAKVKHDQWQFGYAYQDLEADAVVGILTDSDFGGGGTDAKGHILQASYTLSNSIGLQGTLFLNDRNMDFGTEQDFKRLMLDVSFKY